MTAWLEEMVSAIPLPLLEVWGRFAYLVGLSLAICAFGGFTFRIGEHWGFGRARQMWDAKAFLSVPLTFVLIIGSGFVGSFIVLVPGAQTFESLKDLVVLLCIVLLGYPALIAVPPAYMLSDLIEGVPPGFVLDWAEGYFFWTAFVWMAYQLIGRNPDFRRAQTWRRYGMFVAFIMFLDPLMWGYICSGKFTSEISYSQITPALAFTLLVTWALGPLAFLIALPLARRFGWFWADTPGRVRERGFGDSEWAWVSGRGQASGEAEAMQTGLPIRVFIFTPFVLLLLAMVGATAVVALRSANDDATMLATRLHEAMSANIRLRLDELLERSPSQIDAQLADNLASLLRDQAFGTDGRALVLDGGGKIVASSAPEDDAVVTRAVAALGEQSNLASATTFQFDHVTTDPLSRQTWLAHTAPYLDNDVSRDWILVTAMPEAYYLAGLRVANSRTAMVFAVALVLSLLLAAALASMVGAPLRHIAEATQRMAGRGLNIRVPGSKLLELDALAKSFNATAARLKTTFDDLVGEVETRKLRERELEESDARLRSSEAEARDRMFQLARMNRRAVAGELSASIAHEINQPLAAIVSSGNAGLRWLSNQTPDLEEARAALERIVKDGHRASDVIGTVRAMVKQEPQDRKPHNINEVVTDTLAFLRNELNRHQVTVRTDLTEPLPTVLIDRVQLQQVILNLIINAIDAMDEVPDQENVLAVKTEMNDSGDVTVVIEDNGPGIDPSNINRIFDPFFTTKTSGMGMGLSICQSLVESHGGALTVAPAKKQGSEFRILLPVKQGDGHG